jgi:hypothetical protein
MINDQYSNNRYNGVVSSAFRDITLADLDAELARWDDAIEPGRPVDESGPQRDPEAIVVLLIPKGSPFEMYAAAIVPAVAGSHGLVRAVRIDTRAEPEAPGRFGLSGGPGIVLFVNGKQMAAFAVPFADAMPPFAMTMMKGIGEMLKGFLPPPAGDAP